jgi:hypothetical protein
MVFEVVTRRCINQVDEEVTYHRFDAALYSISQAGCVSERGMTWKRRWWTESGFFECLHFDSGKVGGY